MPTRTNGQLVFAHYTWNGDRFTPEGISVLALRGNEIADLAIFRTPDLFARFGLPEALE